MNQVTQRDSKPPKRTPPAPAMPDPAELEANAKTCKTCKHWVDDPGSDLLHPYDLDAGDMMVLPFEVRVCRTKRLLFFERPIESDQAAVIDGSVYYAGLISGPDFYCANWETMTI